MSRNSPNNMLKYASEVDVSRVDRPLPADQPGHGADNYQDRAQTVHEAKHDVGTKGVGNLQKLQQCEKQQLHEREDWVRTRFATPHPNRFAWSKVYRRVTVDRDTNEFLEDLQIEPNRQPKDF